MPCDCSKYPKDWKAIRAEVLERAGHKCEGCGVRNYAIMFDDLRGIRVEHDGSHADDGFDYDELDFVYIDANHMRPMIDADLRAWWPNVRPGGIFGGHDYHMVDRPDYRCEVRAAVDEFFAGMGRTIHVTQDADPSWYVIK